MQWSKRQTKNRKQQDKRNEEGPSLDWLKTSLQSARSEARPVCSSLKFSLTSVVSSSIRDLFISSLMLTQRVFNVRNEATYGWNSPRFFSYPPAFFLSWCQSVRRQEDRQKYPSDERVLSSKKCGCLIERRGHTEKDISGFFIKLPISFLTFATIHRPWKKAFGLPSLWLWNNRITERGPIIWHGKAVHSSG